VFPLAQPFVPHPLLRNAHLMTIAAAFWPRRFPALPAPEPRLLEIATGVRLRLDCHWQRERSAPPTLLLVHGLEGSSESHYILGTAEKAWRAGFNVVRMNVRNCGKTEHLSLTLYHSGLSGDIEAVAQHLLDVEALRELHLAGFSMGGNMILKQAGEWSGNAPRAISVVTTGIPVSSANSSSSGEESDLMTPQPTYRTGDLASAIRRAASRTCLPCGLVTGR